MTPIDYGIIHCIAMQPDEVDYMINIIKELPKPGLMVEWGSGGSTCKWLEILDPSQKLISIEHNLYWYNDVRSAISNYFDCQPPNFEYLFRPEKFNYEHGYGGAQEENPFGLDEYIVPDEKIFDADVYFIDGIARAACIAITLLKRKKKNAQIIVHDYIGRENLYAWIGNICKIEAVGTTLAKITFNETDPNK